MSLYDLIGLAGGLVESTGGFLWDFPLAYYQIYLLLDISLDMTRIRSDHNA